MSVLSPGMTIRCPQEGSRQSVAAGGPPRTGRQLLKKRRAATVLLRMQTWASSRCGVVLLAYDDHAAPDVLALGAARSSRPTFSPVRPRRAACGNISTPVTVVSARRSTDVPTFVNRRQVL